MLTVLSYFAVFVVGFLFGLGVMSILPVVKITDLRFNPSQVQFTQDKRNTLNKSNSHTII